MVARDAILMAPHSMPWAEGLALQHSAFLKHAADLTRAAGRLFLFYSILSAWWYGERESCNIGADVIL